MDIVEYKRIVVALRPSLLAVARRITGNTEDAEDVVQDVCLKIWHFRARFDPYENMEAYSTTMVKNLSIDKIRCRKPFSDETELLGNATEEQLPDSLLEEKEERDAIRRIIGMLPPLQQRILQMKDIEGYETGEITEITGMAAEAVRNNLSRARKRMRELYIMYYRNKQATK
ncbi:sigma-70 family RNA polymerase sigma factor [uncultured Proteiniphilum sp.]|uniref:RNA polymerase sigma factor n=1 Tax=uncultured Proteiniphilum sp. TaxID=497637 RepID=UPI0026179934|nr:sigma-70 family RNA polymerase sigma factor [uncultured Proteiniphilum sp.]